MTHAALAFVFPGQGSQKVGMLADLAERFPIVNETFAEASEVLGYDLWELTQSGPQEKLNQTEITQPLLLTASIACYRAYEQSSDVRPAVVAGHSLGEWSALVAAGVVAFKDAVKLVASRGALMQKAVPQGEGGMAAILGLRDVQVREVCSATGAHAVNFNCPGQVVIAGDNASVEAAIAAATEAGAKRAIALAVSAPFHTPMMKPAADALAAEVDAVTFNKPSIRVIHNVTVTEESSPEAIKAIMLEQIYSPVRWTETAELFASSGIETIIGCGPGKVLCGLNKKVSRSFNVASLEDTAGFDKALGMVE